MLHGRRPCWRQERPTLGVASAEESTAASRSASLFLDSGDEGAAEQLYREALADAFHLEWRSLYRVPINLITSS